MTRCLIDENAVRSPPCKNTLPGIATCPLCEKPMCPVCNRHNVTQLSRVTGYIQDVSGWNQGKQQELRDRKKYNLV